jgi:hypothetical protein
MALGNPHRTRHPYRLLFNLNNAQVSAVGVRRF